MKIYSENHKITQAVILAGGKGTRMSPFTETNPKPMFPFNNTPFIEHLIRQIKGFGISNVLILLGYMSEKIVDFLGDGSKYAMNITYDITPVEFDTGSRFFHAKSLIEEHFLLMYCDNYCPIDFNRLVEEYFHNNAWVQISAYENKDEYTKSNLLIEENGLVMAYDKSRTLSNLSGVDIGYAIINSNVFDLLDENNNNFESIVYPSAVRNSKMYATITKHRYYSVGSWQRIPMAEDFFNNKKTVFLDRDGTLNKKAPQACYIEKSEDFIWLSNAKYAIQLLKENDFRVIIITNQPGIARGNLTENTLLEIHNKMQEDLKELNVEIDKIYYCPHNWNDGCDCRKPKPGMLYQAQKDFSLNLELCYLIGDDDRDIEAGNSVKCKTFKVDEKYTLLDAVNDILGGEK